MLMLTFFAPKFDEAKLWSTASQVSSEFFFDEVRNSGLGSSGSRKLSISSSR